jgi:hypothetical protein
MSTPLEQALGEEAITETEAPEVTDEQDAEISADPPEQEPEAEEPEAAPEDTPRDEKGKFAKKEKADEPDPKAWQYAAYQDEKQKRQQYEREAEQLRAQMQQLQTQQQQKRIDPIDDPEGFERSLEQRIEQRLLSERIQFSERLARNQHGDEAWQQTNEWLHSQPATIRHQFAQSPDPCGEAVKAFKRHQVMQEIGDDPASYRERLEAEIRERLIAEQQPAAPQVSQPKPSNFASARSAGKRTGPAWAGPTPLSQVLPE